MSTSILIYILIIFLNNIDIIFLSNSNKNNIDIFLSLDTSFSCSNSNSNSKNYIFDLITSHNFKTLFHSKSPFLLYITSTWCDYCCQQSKILSYVQKNLINSNNKIIKNIRIYQIQSDENLNILKEYKIFISKIPSLYLYINTNEIIHYSYYFDKKNIIYFIEKNLSELKHLQTKEEITLFLSSKKIKIKLIGIFTDKKEYNDEYKQFLKYSSEIKYRMNVEIRIIDNKNITSDKNFKYSNEILIKRFDNFYHLDIISKAKYMKEFIYYNCFASAEELTNQNKNIISQLITPVALFFIDTTYNIKNFKNVLEYLEKLSFDYDLKYVFLYIDGGAKSESKIKLGLDDIFPTLVIHDSKNKKIIKFPKEKILSDTNIRNFLNENMKKREEERINQEKYMIKNDVIMKKLKKFEYININKLDNIFYNNNDNYLFFIVNEYSNEENEISLVNIFSNLYDIIKEYGIDYYIKIFWISEYESKKYKNKHILLNSKIILKTEKIEKYKINLDDSEDRIKINFFKWLKNCTNDIFELPNELNDDYEELYKKYYEKIGNEERNDL